MNELTLSHGVESWQVTSQDLSEGFNLAAPPLSLTPHPQGLLVASTDMTHEQRQNACEDMLGRLDEINKEIEALTGQGNDVIEAFSGHIRELLQEGLNLANAISNQCRNGELSQAELDEASRIRRNLGTIAGQLINAIEVIPGSEAARTRPSAPPSSDGPGFLEWLGAAVLWLISLPFQGRQHQF